MERNDREGMLPDSGGEQTSFGQINPAFESSTSSSSGTAGTGFGKTENSISDSDRGVKQRVKSVASNVKDKASGIPAMLADGLQAGAQALRQRSVSTETSGAGSSVAVSSDPNIAAVTDTLASGMESSAEWLRDADLDKIKQGVEKQVKEHPARSLLVALGAGYLIGKALRR
ncbi:MAG TPA: hypothetical protein VGO75_09350 [Gemmatimonadaceae bacterium]|jgi:hypothetical protein|nr:hypothetical protein [Gemmatimonadaceae bacterium]